MVGVFWSKPSLSCGRWKVNLLVVFEIMNKDHSWHHCATNHKQMKGRDTLPANWNASADNHFFQKNLHSLKTTCNMHTQHAYILYFKYNTDYYKANIFSLFIFWTTFLFIVSILKFKCCTNMYEVVKPFHTKSRLYSAIILSKGNLVLNLQR